MVISAVVSIAATSLALAAGASMQSLHARPAQAAMREVTTIVTKRDPPPRPLPPKVVTVFQDIPVVRAVVVAPRSVSHAVRPSVETESQPRPTLAPRPAPTPTPKPQPSASELPCPGYPEYTVQPANGCPEGGDD